MRIVKLLAVLAGSLLASALVHAVNGQESDFDKRLADMRAELIRLQSETYTSGCAESIRTGKPLVTFIGSDARKVPGAVVARCNWLDGYEGSQIVVSVPARGFLDERAVLPVTATDAEILAAISPRTVSRPVAAPFGHDPQAADDSPWLAVSEQERIRKMWPAGVPFPDGLKFYEQKPAFQYLQGLNNVAVREVRLYGNGDGTDPWKTSGGLHAVDSSEWYNRRGFVLPGSIRFWEEYIFIGAPERFRTNRVRYAFPKGTLAYDVLIKRGKPDNIFAIRVHEKQSDQMHDWDDGTVYGPNVDTANASKSTYEWGFARFGIQAKSTVFTVGRIDPKVEFVATRNVVEDGGQFTPKGFVGAGVRCNDCHQQTGRIEHHGTHSDGDYSKLGRGDDGRFWHPFDAAGNVDTRWPLIRAK